MKAAAFQPPEVDRRTGRPLKLTTPYSVSDSSGVSASESPQRSSMAIFNSQYDFAKNKEY